MSSGEFTDTGDLTFGGKAVGLTFNPTADSEVTAIKGAAAQFIDVVCGPSSEKLISNAAGDNGEAIAMRKLALRAAQEAQMWAVKAATWGN